MAKDELPDVRDGLTPLERAILLVLDELRRERGDRHHPTRWSTAGWSSA